MSFCTGHDFATIPPPPPLPQKKKKKKMEHLIKIEVFWSKENNFHFIWLKKWTL